MLLEYFLVRLVVKLVKLIERFLVVHKVVHVTFIPTSVSDVYLSVWANLALVEDIITFHLVIASQRLQLRYKVCLLVPNRLLALRHAGEL